MAGADPPPLGCCGQVRELGKQLGVSPVCLGEGLGWHGLARWWRRGGRERSGGPPASVGGDCPDTLAKQSSGDLACTYPAVAGFQGTLAGGRSGNTVARLQGVSLQAAGHMFRGQGPPLHDVLV